MTTIDALKNLYVELGGHLADVENVVTIPAMIDALSEIAGSTIELPAVSSTDNGDILTVVNGKWAKAEAPEELPAVTTTDEGNALIVDSEGKWAKSAIPSQLPAVTSEDAGKVLTVNSGGAWEAEEAVANKFVLIEATQSTYYGGILTLPSGMVQDDIIRMIKAGKVVNIITQVANESNISFNYCFTNTYEDTSGGVNKMVAVFQCVTDHNKSSAVVRTFDLKENNTTNTANITIYN